MILNWNLGLIQTIDTEITFKLLFQFEYKYNIDFFSIIIICPLNYIFFCVEGN